MLTTSIRPNPGSNPNEPSLDKTSIPACSDGRWFMTDKIEKTGERSFETEINAVLPHRYPFLFVDRVTEFVPGVRIVGTKRFAAGDHAPQGHFPSSPIIP